MLHTITSAQIDILLALMHELGPAITATAEILERAANALVRTFLRRWAMMGTSSDAHSYVSLTPLPAARPTWKMSWWAPVSGGREWEGY